MAAEKSPLRAPSSLWIKCQPQSLPAAPDQRQPPSRAAVAAAPADATVAITDTAIAATTARPEQQTTPATDTTIAASDGTVTVAETITAGAAVTPDAQHGERA